MSRGTLKTVSFSNNINSATLVELRNIIPVKDPVKVKWFVLKPNGRSQVALAGRGNDAFNTTGSRDNSSTRGCRRQGKDCIFRPPLTELTSQIFNVLSSDAETRRLESDDQATSEIPCNRERLNLTKCNL